MNVTKLDFVLIGPEERHSPLATHGIIGNISPVNLQLTYSMEMSRMPLDLRLGALAKEQRNDK